MLASNTQLFPCSRPRSSVRALLFLTSAVTCSACLQGYRFPIEKPKVQIEKPRVDLPLGIEAATASERENAQLEKYVEDFAARPAGTASFEDTTDYAVALVFLGRARAAVNVLLALEQQRPGVYTTATNLGTDYELLGELDNAQTWISQGIERNVKSHEGTEWLHLAILRAKSNFRADANWFQHHTVLDETSGTRSAAETMRAIEYQLHERLHFVQPVDAVVCDLFYQAALLAQSESEKTKRQQLLRESLRFGDWRKLEAEKLLKG